MRHLRTWIESRFTRRHKPKRPFFEVPGVTTLAGLLPELVLSISDFLPIVDLICFSVCNHRLRELSLRQMHQLLPLTQDDKLSILTRLERDLPEYFACEVCKLLHRYNGSESIGLSGLSYETSCPLPCVKEWFGLESTLRTHSVPSHAKIPVSFLQLKLAMRRFYYGPKSGVSTASLSHTQVSHHRIEKSNPTIISLFSREAQICPKPPAICIRTQDILVGRTLDELILDPNELNSDPFEICPHFGPLGFTPLKQFFDKKEDNSFAYNCHMCNTDYLVEITEFDFKLALIMTKWVNLGPCLTQEDLLWKCHVQCAYGSRARLDGDDPIRDPTAYNPRLCFENMAPQSFEDLRSRNLSYLRQQKYKNGQPFFKARGDDSWHISYEKPLRSERADKERTVKPRNFSGSAEMDAIMLLLWSGLV